MIKLLPIAQFSVFVTFGASLICRFHINIITEVKMVRGVEGVSSTKR